MTESDPTGNNGLTIPNYMCECNGEWHLKGSRQCVYVFKRDSQSNSTFTPHYTSIQCIHARHEDCDHKPDQDAKDECPYCGEPCKCDCHQSPTTSTDGTNTVGNADTGNSPADTSPPIGPDAGMETLMGEMLRLNPGLTRTGPRTLETVDPPDVPSTDVP